MAKKQQTYDFICFCSLAYEFQEANKIIVENEIKRKLEYYKLGDYDQQRIDYIRTLRNDLFAEISLQEESKYYGKPKSKYADLSDFDLARMKTDYLKEYDRLHEKDLDKILNFAVYIFYLR